MRAKWNNTEMKFVFVLVALALVVAVDAGVSVNNPFYCYFSDPVRPQVQMHSVRTSYEAVRRTAVNPSVSCRFRMTLWKCFEHFENICLACNPTRFWFLSRHGGRLPETPLLQRMLDFADSSVNILKETFSLRKATHSVADFCNRFKSTLFATLTMGGQLSADKTLSLFETGSDIRTSR